MSAQTTRRILKLLAPYRARVALAFALTAAACLLNLPAPLLIQGLVDRIASTGRLADLPWFTAGLLLVFAAQAGIGLAIAYVMGPVGLAVVHDLRHALYARLQRLGLSFYDRMTAGAIISRVMDDCAAVRLLITGQTLAILTDLGTTLAIAGLLLWRSPRLAMLTLAFVPVYAVIFQRFTRRIREGSTEVRRRLDVLFGHLKETLDAALVVKACAREEAEMAAFAVRLDEAHGARVGVGRLGAAFSNLSGAISGLGTAVVFAAGAFEALQGRITPGEDVSTTTLAGLLFGPVARLADLASVFEQAAASIERLGEVLDLQPDVAEPEHPVPIGQVSGGVEFDRVSFGYKRDEPVVWDIRLKIRPGMKVALVGPTGCGKTTLMNLLLRFYDPTWGEIRLDGVPLRALATADLRRQIGVVLQEPILFRDTVAENIRYGAPEADDARVQAAARAALVHDLVERLPQGYQTIIGEGGHKLSQGERQCLAIARALCTNPAIVVLDEATSALDTGSEVRIQAALRNLLHGRTAFIIAHRLSTIVDADLIVVMDGGLIVQAGTHDELLAEEDGLYRRLCERQFGLVAPMTPWRLDEAEEIPRRPLALDREAEPPAVPLRVAG
ncbi:MAG: ABC transporter ATP-binding protein [Isosphaeraceae bacterium]|nr:ABC transporter ATP-binding protein [Isosphaeraceae bacterium]